MAYVLIVEDESIVAWNLQEALENFGHTIVAMAASGTEAIQIAEAMRPDLVLMDIHLEGEMDGISAGQAIYSRFQIPIVYLTAHTDDPTLQRAMTILPFGYLIKPFQEKVLHSTIEIAVRRNQLEQELTHTLDSIGDATIAINCAGEVTLINQQAQVLTGWQEAEAIGKPVDQILNFIHPDTREVLTNPLLQALQLKRKVKLPNPCLLVGKAGLETSVGDTAAPITNFQGEITGSVAVLQMLDTQFQQEMQTAQHGSSEVPLHLSIACLHALKQVLVQAQQAHEQTQVLETIVEALSQALGADYCWVTLHNSTSAILLYDAVNGQETLYNLEIGTKISLRRWKNFYTYLARRGYWIFPGSEIDPPTPYEPLLTEQSQVLVCAMANQSTMFGEIGFVMADPCDWFPDQVDFMVQVIQQCTIIWQQVFTYQNTQNRLNELELKSLRSNFIDAVSQEFRTPLTVMRLATEMLRETTQSISRDMADPSQLERNDRAQQWQKVDQYFQLLQEAWQQEHDLIEDLLTFQTLQPLPKNLPRSCIRVQDWLPKMLEESLSGQLLKSNIAIQCEVASDLPVLVTHVPSLERVVTELLTSASRWTPPQEPLIVTVKATEGQFVLQVTSRGLEIPRRELRNIFEPFYRLVGEYTNSQGNTGLGLALAKKLVIQLGGDIKADSETGRTMLKVILPFESSVQSPGTETDPTEP